MFWHSADVADVKKFTHLRNCLTGAAARDITGYVSRKLSTAFELLIDSYGKRHVIIQAHMTARPGHILNLCNVASTSIWQHKYWTNTNKRNWVIWNRYSRNTSRSASGLSFNSFTDYSQIILLGSYASHFSHKLFLWTTEIYQQGIKNVIASSDRVCKQKLMFFLTRFFLPNL